MAAGCPIRGRAEWLARQAAKAPGASAAAEPRISQKCGRFLPNGAGVSRGAHDPPPAPEKVTAEAILRAAAIAKGELTELPPVGSPARSILESCSQTPVRNSRWKTAMTMRTNPFAPFAKENRLTGEPPPESEKIQLKI